MPESFIPVWMSLGEATEFRRFLQEEARSTEDEFPEREFELIDTALRDEHPRSFAEMDAEQKPPTQEVQPQPLQPIDDKVEAFRKRFFDITGDRLQRTAVVEGLRAVLGGEAVGPVGEEGLPAPLLDALRDRTVFVAADQGHKLADGRTLAEHLEAWRNAPSNTMSSFPVGQTEDERQSPGLVIDATEFAEARRDPKTKELLRRADEHGRSLGHRDHSIPMRHHLDIRDGVDAHIQRMQEAGYGTDTYWPLEKLLDASSGDQLRDERESTEEGPWKVVYPPPQPPQSEQSHTEEGS